jgi:hypothetical protein
VLHNAFELEREELFFGFEEDGDGEAEDGFDALCEDWVAGSDKGDERPGSEQQSRKKGDQTMSKSRSGREGR